MKFTFGVKTKAFKDYPLTERLEKMYEGNIQCVLPDDYGIVTASNASHFPGLQLMLFSIIKKYDAPVLVFDVGMTKEQTQWLSKLPRVKIAPKIDILFNRIDYWQAWIKPIYIKNSPFKKTMWIDCDTIVTGELMDIVEEASDKPLFTADHSGIKEGTYNNDDLYKIMPIEGVSKDTGEYLNTGVFIIDIERDFELLDEWLNCVLAAGENPEIAKAIMCWDQGACKWALQKLNMLNTINSKKEYNFPARSRQCPFPVTHKAMDVFLNNIKQAIDDKVVVFHWMGSPKPWINWTNMLSIKIN